MTAKRILLVVMCALILTVLIMTAMVLDRVMPILVALGGGFDIDFGSSTTESSQMTESTPTTEATEPSESTAPTEQTQPTQPPETTVPTEPAHEHSFTTVIRTQKVTCIYTGYTIYGCECGQNKMMDIVDALGHNYSTQGAKAPTCTQDGYKQSCLNCGDVRTADVLSALGHDYQPTTDAKASCTETVTVEYACAHCGGKTWETLEATGHSGQWVVTQEPANGEPGVETLENCANCGGTFTRPAVMTITNTVSGEDQGAFLLYTIHVGTANTPQAFTYIIRDYSKSENLLMRWTQNGLNVTYNETNSLWVKTLSLQDLELTINAEGKVGPVETPDEPSEPSEPSEPVEDPSEPVEDPSEPAEDPSEPSEPAGSEEESNPSAPSEPEEESQPSEPVEESQPSEPVQE